MKNIITSRKTQAALGILAVVAVCQTAQAQSHVFSWADYGTPISNVQAGDSFVINNVDGSGVDFTFTFGQELDARTVSSFKTIVSPSNPANDFPVNYTGNANFEGLYASNPLYLVSKSQWNDDKLTLSITTSSPIQLADMIIGDLDRYTYADGAADYENTYEDFVSITSSLKGSSVGVDLSTTSGSIRISENMAESISGGLLDSSLAASQINVSTKNYVDTIRIVYQNSDASRSGLANTDDGWSNSHWITLGTDKQFTAFNTVPEPSSVMLTALGFISFILRRKRQK